MKSLTTKILVVVVAIAIIAPATYFAYEYFNKSNISPSIQPYEYIPGNSTMIASLNENNSSYLAYEIGGQFGIVSNLTDIAKLNSSLNFSSAIQPASISGNSGLSFLSNLNFTTESYHGKTLYEIKNISLSAILDKFILPSGNISNNKTVNMYLYITSTDNIVIGEINAVHDSILASIHNKTAVKLQPFINASDNLSVYYNLTGTSGLQYLTLNSTSNLTDINIVGNFNDIPVSVIQDYINSVLPSNITAHVSKTNDGMKVSIDRGYSSLGLIIQKLNL